jgi:dTDP-4-dehydrorhamnose reductase
MHKESLQNSVRPELVEGLGDVQKTFNILLLGKDGQLGRELQRSLAPLGTLTAWGRETADFSKPEALAALVLASPALAVKPSIIVNAAAYTAVDKAESEPELAHTINAKAPAVLALAAKQLGARLIHYSTDYVFDGSGSLPWTEASPTCPQNVYGASKLAGEQAIQASGCNYWIFRTSWVYAQIGGNFAKTMLRLAGERDSLSVIDDQIGAPTDAAWLADMTAGAILRQAQDERKRTVRTEPKAVRTEPVEVTNGIYHAACAGEVSWHGYASYLIGRARAMGLPIRVTPEAMRAVPSSAFPTPAKRPHNSRLDCTRLTATFGIQPPPWQQGIDRLMDHLIKEIKEEKEA